MMKYKCGHERVESIILDNNELSITCYLEWAKSVGLEGTKEQCWDCYLKELETHQLLKRELRLINTLMTEVNSEEEYDELTIRHQEIEKILIKQEDKKMTYTHLAIKEETKEYFDDIQHALKKKDKRLSQDEIVKLGLDFIKADIQ